MIKSFTPTISGKCNRAFAYVMFAVLTLFVTGANAQVSVFQFSGNGGTPALDMPICKSTAKWSSSAMLYPASGFNGGNGFGSIQKIGYYCDGAFFSANAIPIKIWIATVPTSTTTLSGSTWSAATAGATLVYTGNFNLGSAGGWCDITLTTPFTWSSGNLVIFVENDWGALTTVVGDPNWDYNQSTGNTDVNWTSNSSAAALGSSSACCTTPDNFRADIELTVNTCTAPVISGQPSTALQTVCLNDATTALSVTATGTGTLTYQWYQNASNANTGGTLISGATSSTYTPLSISAGALYYYCVVTGGCSTTSNTSGLVTVVGAPATPGTISGPASVCDLSLNTYSVSSVSGATSYTWTLPTGWSGTSTTNSISATQGTGGGNITVTANNGCGNSSAQTLAVTSGSAPATPTAVLGPDSVCALTTNNTFAVNAVNGATSYTWTLPNGWSGTSTTAAIIATAGSTGGTISVTANNSCGSSTAQTMAVSVAAATATPGAISGPNAACGSSPYTYSVAPVSGATSYTWTLPGTWTGSSTVDSIGVTAGASGGTISVTANGFCGSSSAQTLVVTSGSAPATPAAILGSASVCSSSSNNTFAVNAVNGATSYTWTLPNGWSGTSTTAVIIVTAGSTGGTISVTANNACGSSTAQTLAVGVDAAVPSTPGSVTQTGTACNGGTDTFSIAPVTNATSYTWTLPNTWSGSSTTINIISTVGSSAGNVSVSANNACGSSVAQTLAATLGAVPATPGAILGSASVCSSSSNNTFYVNAVNGATSYTWTLPNGWSGTSTTQTMIATAGSTGGAITVAANNACGSSSPQTLAVGVVSAAPATPGAILQTGGSCTGGADTFSVAAVNGATSYTWTLPNTWTGTSTADSIISTVGSGGGNVTVVANNACGISQVQTLAVTLGSSPAVPVAILGPDSLCALSTNNTFAVNPVNGATSYTWTLPNGWSGTSTTAVIIATAGSTGGTISVTANNACGSSAAQTVAVTISSGPSMPAAILGPDTLCALSTNNTFAVNPVSGATSYTWTLPNGWSGTSTTSVIIATAGSTGGTISVTANNACGSSAAQTVTVVVKPTPQVLFSYSGGPVCNNVNPTVTLSGGTPAGGTYSGQGVTGATFNASTLSAGNYTVTYSYTNAQGCYASDTANIAVQVCVGIASIDAAEISVYPNPFNDEVIIDTKGAYGNGVATLLDVTGREMNRTEFESGVHNVQVNTSLLAKGAYILNIVVEGKLVAVKKMVKVE